MKDNEKKTEMKIDDELMYRFFQGKTSPEESDALGRWLDEDKSRGTVYKDRQAEYKRIYKLYVTGEWAVDEAARNKASIIRPQRNIWRGVIAIAAAAAALVIGILIWHPATGEQLLVAQAPVGGQKELTLPDGSRITLNSLSRLEYPQKFKGHERRVRLEGEAMFDVAHNERHPFIVQTYAYDVKVLGTKFDVIAQEADHQFITALLRGSVAICKDGRQMTRLTPGDKVNMTDEGLEISKIDLQGDAFSWTTGVLNVSGLTFSEIVDCLERCYGVKIVVDRQTPPQVNYGYLKLRISDGFEYAINVLEEGSDFTCTYNPDTKTYHIG